MVEQAPRKFPLMPLAGLGIVLVAGLIAILIARSVASGNAWVDHSVRMQTRIIDLSERLATHDAALRGYLISRLPATREDLTDSRHDILRDLAVLRREMADNALQEREVAAITPLIHQRLAYSQWLERERDARPLDQLVGTLGGPNGRPLIRSIHAGLGRLFATESELLADRQEDVQWRIALLSIGLAAAVSLVVIVAYFTVTEARTRYEAIDAAHREASAAADAAQAEMRARELAEDQLRQAQKMETLGQLTGGIAHDFNNMLAVVIGSIDMAQRRADDPARLARSLAAAAEGAERAAALVGRLLAYARRQALTPVPTDANRLVAGMEDLLARTLGEDVAIETRLAPGIWPTFVDHNQLENAIINLALNARDAMGGRGRLTIVTDNLALESGTGELPPGDYVAILVRDYGRGMTPEVLARASDPFFTTKGVGKGTGLGLSQVFGFVKQSGGTVAIESVVDEGTSIRLILPRHDTPAEIPALVEVPAASQCGSAREPILLVEDDDRVRHYSLEAVRDLGYPAVAAADGAQALAMIEQNPDIALLFTDIVMPGMSGIELASAVHARRPDIRVLYTTGYAHEQIARRGLSDAGAVILPKPFTVAQLATKLRDALEGAPAAVQPASSGAAR